jgi:rhodanese-related sulfurtransferase
VSAASAPYANGSVISAKQGKELLDQGDVVLVDVRRQYEYDAGHIKGALLVPNETINAKSDPPLLPDKQAVILLYCRSGARAGVAMKNLIKRGYTHVYSMGGIINWSYGLVTD